jgi:cell pole-organizing protein PopZ
MSKPDNKAGEEMSMEDILASIRKMIAQDEDNAENVRPTADEETLAQATEGEALPPGTIVDEDEEVLELTEVLPEEIASGSSAWGDPYGESAPVLPEEEPLDLEAEFSADEFNEAVTVEDEIEDASAAQPVWSIEPSPPPLYRPVVTVGLTDMMEPLPPRMPEQYEETAAQAPNIPSYLEGLQDLPDETDSVYEADDSVAAPLSGDSRDFALEPQEEVVSMDAPKERILSPETAVKTSTAFDQLAQTLVSGYAGEEKTLEGVVRAMLKPLMKEWLDANLPRIVEDMIQAEIRRLSR